LKSRTSGGRLPFHAITIRAPQLGGGCGIALHIHHAQLFGREPGSYTYTQSRK